MSTLPPIQTPDDFERTVYLRSLLSALPPIETPVSFENNVLKKARGSGSAYKLLIVATTVLALFGGVVWWTSQPDIVAVRAFHQIELPIVDLYDLPPVPVVQDSQYKDLPRAVVHKLAVKMKVRPVVRAPHGVAGH